MSTSSIALRSALKNPPHLVCILPALSTLSFVTFLVWTHCTLINPLYKQYVIWNWDTATVLLHTVSTRNRCNVQPEDCWHLNKDVMFWEKGNEFMRIHTMCLMSGTVCKCECECELCSLYHYSVSRFSVFIRTAEEWKERGWYAAKKTHFQRLFVLFFSSLICMGNFSSLSLSKAIQSKEKERKK